MEQNIIWKADCHSACQKIFCFLYGTGRFISVFTKVHHVSLSCTTWIRFAQSIHISLRSSCILSSHLCLILPSQIALNTSPISHACHKSHSIYLLWFYHPNNMSWRIPTVNFIIMQFSPSTVSLPFISKYPPQHCPQQPSVYVRPPNRETSFTSLQHNRQNYTFIYFNF
jgi:hypothetical protein